MFGGYDFSNTPQNVLYKVKIKHPSAIVLKVTTKGTPPPARYLHGMVLMESSIFSLKNN